MTNTPLLPYIAEGKDLAQLLQHAPANLLVVDLGSAENHQRGHVPGAVHLAYGNLVCGAPPAPGKLPNKDHLEEVFNHLGLTPETHVVAYDDEGGAQAGRFLWTLELAGHQHMSFLNGGLHAWIADQLPLEQALNQATPSRYPCQWDFAPRLSAEEIMAKLGNSAFTVWDARTPGEYTGVKAQALRNGHIPGAINCEWTQLHDTNNALRIRADAKEFLQAQGFTPDKEIVTHCQSHRRSGFTYVVGKSLGLNIKAYDGSWSEWGNREDTPIEV